MEREVRGYKTSDKDGGYFNMKGDGAMLAYTKIWMKGVSRLSAHEIVQTIIGINLLIVSVVNVCILALKKDNKK